MLLSSFISLQSFPSFHTNLSQLHLYSEQHLCEHSYHGWHTKRQIPPDLPDQVYWPRLMKMKARPFVDLRSQMYPKLTEELPFHRLCFSLLKFANGVSEYVIRNIETKALFTKISEKNHSHFTLEAAKYIVNEPKY